MFGQMLLQIGLQAAIEALKNPKKKKFRKWLFSDEVKNTLHDFLKHYTLAEAQLEEEGGEG